MNISPITPSLCSETDQSSNKSSPTPEVIITTSKLQGQHLGHLKLHAQLSIQYQIHVWTPCLVQIRKEVARLKICRQSNRQTYRQYALKFFEVGTDNIPAFIHKCWLHVKTAYIYIIIYILFNLVKDNFTSMKLQCYTMYATYSLSMTNKQWDSFIFIHMRTITKGKVLCEIPTLRWQCQSFLQHSVTGWVCMKEDKGKECQKVVKSHLICLICLTAVCEKIINQFCT